MNYLRVTSCLVLFLLSGCTAFQVQPTHPASGMKKKLEKFWTMDITDGNFQQVAWGRMRSIDLAYNQYVNALYSEKKTADFIADSSLATLAGFTTLGTKAFTTKEVEVFGLASGLITATRGNLNSGIYYNRTIDLIIRTMNQLRKTQKQLIVSKLGSTGSKNEILFEIDKYFEVGTLTASVDFLNNQKPTDGEVEKYLNLDTQRTFQKWKTESLRIKNKRMQQELESKRTQRALKAFDE